MVQALCNLIMMFHCSFYISQMMRQAPETDGDPVEFKYIFITPVSSNTCVYSLHSGTTSS
jgi:hypothetical protein